MGKDRGGSSWQTLTCVGYDAIRLWNRQIIEIAHVAGVTIATYVTNITNCRPSASLYEYPLDCTVKGLGLSCGGRPPLVRVKRESTVLPAVCGVN